MYKEIASKMKRVLSLILLFLLTLSVTAAQDNAGKTLTIGLNSDVFNFDPHHSGSAIVNNRVFGMVFDQLVATNPQGELEPMLATAWKNVDNTKWIFTLRPDVKFHDGTVMTAEDAAFSLNRLLFSDQESRVRAGILPYIESVEVTGDLEITVTTPKVDPLLPLRLASPYAVIVPKAYVEANDFETLQKGMVGAGPYRLVDWITGERIVLERNDEYWMGPADAEQVIIRIIPEIATRIAALQAGEVDFVTTIPPDQIESVDTTENLHVDTVPVLNYMNIWFNTNEGFITADARIRQALSLGIDRQAITDSLWEGRVRVMNDYLLPGEFGYDSERPIFEYNPEKAKELLAEAGYNNEVIEFTPPASYYTNGQIVTEVISEMWKAIGINVSYQPLDTAAWADRSVAGNNVVTLQSFGTNGDPATNGAISNWISWPGMYYKPSEEFNTLADEAASSLDSEVRLGNYRRIFEILDQDVPFAPLYQSVEFYGMRDGITWTSHPEFYINLRPGVFTID